MIEVNYQYINRQDSFERVLPSILELKRITLDVETTGLDPHKDQVILCQVGNTEIQYLIDTRTVNILPLKAWLENESVVKHGVNLMFDYMMLKSLGIEPEGLFDSMIVEQLLNIGKVHLKTKGFWSLEGMSERYLNYKPNKSLQSSFIGHKGDFYEQQLKYAAEDVILPILIADKQKPRIIEHKLQRIVNLENSVIPSYGDMAWNGFYLDKDKWLDVLQNKKTDLEHCREELVRIFDPYTEKDLFGMPLNLEGKPLNFSSQDQILPIINKMGFFIENTEHLTLLTELPKELHEPLVKFRGTEKAITSFGENFTKHINPKTGRLHCNFFQIGAASGRNAVTNPPIQTVKRDAIYRNCFTPQEVSSKIITIDFGGQEILIATQNTLEPLWLEWNKQGKNIHLEMGLRIWGRAVKKGTPEYNITKNINFCLEKDSLVFVPDKGYVTIESLYKNYDKAFISNKVINLNGHRENITNCFTTGYNDIYEVETKSGICIRGTLNHKVLTKTGWKKIGDLSVNDDDIITGEYLGPNLPTEEKKISFNFWSKTNETAIDNLENIIKVSMDYNWGYVLGALLGDGCVSNNSIMFCSGEDKYLDIDEHFIKCTNNIGLLLTQKKDRKYNGVRYYTIGSNYLRRFLEHIGFIQNSRKTIPDFIFESPKEVISAFLRGYFDTDGWAPRRESKGYVGLCSKYKNDLEKISILLSIFGIIPTMEYSYNKTYNRMYYKLRLNSDAMLKFYKYIGFSSKVKQGKLKRRVDYINQRLQYVKKPINTVTKIKFLKNDITYDISTETTHSFLCNGLVVHNSLMYGAGVYKVMMFHQENGLICNEDQAQIILDKIANTIPVAWKKINANGLNAVFNGYAESLLGFKRWFDVPPYTIKYGRPIAKNKDENWIINKIIREAKNHVIQSTGSQMIKLSLIKARKTFKKERMRVPFICIVHDEIVAEVFDNYEKNYQIIEKSMLEAEKEILPDVVGRIEGTISDVWEK